MDFEEKIKDFWKCSLNNDFSEFDFDEFFDEFYPMLDAKLIDHGYTDDVDAFRERMESYSESVDLGDDLPFWAKTRNDFWQINTDPIIDAICKELMLQIRRNTECCFSEFDELDDLRSQLDDRPTTLPELITLFDACVHACHAYGNILEDETGINIESLRESFETTLDEQENRFPTNIRQYLGGRD